MSVVLSGEEQAGGKRGRFSAGQSGNPAGRPRGSRNRTTQICADLLSADAEAVMRQLIKSAKKGEPLAMRLVVERLVPIRAARDRMVDVVLPDVAGAVDLVVAAAAVVSHATQGNITLSEAKEIMSLLESERKLIETVDLSVRLAVLEDAGRASAVAGKLEELVPGLAARVRVLEPGARAGVRDRQREEM